MEQATIGNINFILGNALIQPKAQVVITTSRTGESRADDTSTVTTVSVILGVIVFVIVASVAAMFIKRMLKKSRQEEYHVAYRHGSDILTLDGLSENNATDVSQNRQNSKYM